MYKIKVYDEITENFKKEFNYLTKNINTKYFYNINWILKILEIQKNKKKKNKFLIYFKNDEPIMACLFQIRKFGCFNILEWFGDEFIDFNYPIIKKNHQFNKNEFFDLWEKSFIKIKKIDLVYFKKQVDEKFIEYRNPFLDFFKTKKSSNIYYINQNLNWDQFYLNQFSSKEKYNHNRSEKKIKKFGKYEFKIASSLEEKKKIINFIIENKFKQKKLLKNFFSYENLKIFIEREDKNFQFQFFYISIDDKILTASICVKSYQTLFYLITVYRNNDDIKKYSPGNILLKKILMTFFNYKLNYFNFCDGNEEYKKKWSNEFYDVYESIMIKTIKGKVLYLLLNLKRILKK